MPPTTQRGPGAAGARRSPGSDQTSLRLLGEQAFSRAAGAPLVPGNRIKRLRDASENYPAWFEAVALGEGSP